MTTIEKIRKVLIDKGIITKDGKPNLTKAERMMVISQGTLSKAFKRDGGDLHPSTQEKFIVTFHVARTWWDTGKGEVFEKNLTSVPKPDEPKLDYPQMMKTMQLLIDSQEREIRRLTKDLDDCNRQRINV